MTEPKPLLSEDARSEDVSETTESFDPAASSLAGQVDRSVMDELLSIRSSIDNIDATLVFLLAERFKATQKVGVLKATHKLPAGDPGRRPPRFPGSGAWPRKRTWIRPSPRSS